MVSKSGQCLNDLLFRWRAITLGGEIVAVVSNHEDLRPIAEAAGLPYIVIPITADTKMAAEDRLRDLVAEYDADLAVLARYMQVLSDGRGLCLEVERPHHFALPPNTLLGLEFLPPGLRTRSIARRWPRRSPSSTSSKTAHRDSPAAPEGQGFRFCSG